MILLYYCTKVFRLGIHLCCFSPSILMFVLSSPAVSFDPARFYISSNTSCVVCSKSIAKTLFSIDPIPSTWFSDALPLHPMSTRITLDISYCISGYFSVNPIKASAPIEWPSKVKEFDEFLWSSNLCINA